MVKIIFLDKSSTNLNKKYLLVKINRPVKIRELFNLAAIQEKNTKLYTELEFLMILYKDKIINHEEALNKTIYPGEEILLLPLAEDG